MRLSFIVPSNEVPTALLRCSIHSFIWGSPNCRGFALSSLEDPLGVGVGVGVGVGCSDSIGTVSLFFILYGYCISNLLTLAKIDFGTDARLLFAPSLTFGLSPKYFGKFLMIIHPSI